MSVSLIPRKSQLSRMQPAFARAWGGLFGGVFLAACQIPAGPQGAIQGTMQPVPRGDTTTNQAASDPAPVARNATDPGAAPARDGNIAIREEYDAAIKENTKAALRRFIDRHPGHPLTAMAQKHLQEQFP